VEPKPRWVSVSQLNCRDARGKAILSRRPTGGQVKTRGRLETLEHVRKEKSVLINHPVVPGYWKGPTNIPPPRKGFPEGNRANV